MREGNFIKQNIERWKSYQEPAEDPDEVAKRFTYLVDDLSYAKTFYPFSNTVRYINSFAAGIYLSIYKNKKEKRNRFVTFWKEELPQVMYNNRGTLLFSFLFFLSFVFIGVFSAANDQTFIRTILGNSYVDMTEHNIANGDPFGVYKNGNPFTMFVQIAFNNIRVSFLCFTTGLLLSVGTLFELFTNGLMVGAFEYMFVQHHLGLQSILTIFIHGTLELSAVVIAGCAGIGLGNAILFPGTYTRLQSLMRAAKDGVKIITGLIPVFITAALFEGFVTRHTEMPIALNMFILLTSLAFILWYFVWYPIHISRKTKNDAPLV
jgi:uncharacterized membrane protein SpoIIM required for sporulation